MSILQRRGSIARLLAALALPIVVLATAGCSGSGQILNTVAAPVSTEAPQLAPATAMPQTPGNPLPPGNGSGPAPAAPRDDLKIVYTGSLDVVVPDLDAALAKGRAAVLATGGYVGASDERRDGENEAAVITYRIPASRWEEALGSLRGLATKVVGEQTQATEVGGQIVDLEARLRNLRASEQVLVGIAEGTGKVQDLLEVQARISDVRGQIEQLDGQRAALEDQVAYGTLVTTFGLEVVQVEQAKAGWNPASDVDGATATLLGALQALVSAGIWFGIVWLPLILAVVVIAAIGRWAFRRFVPAGRPRGPMAGWGGSSD
jgi:hypothetical protein